MLLLAATLLGASSPPPATPHRQQEPPPAVEVRDLGLVGSEFASPAAPFLRRAGPDLVLGFRTADGLRVGNVVAAGSGLGSTRPAGKVDFPASALSGRLELRELPEVHGSSSAMLANGLLLDRGEILGWSPSVASADGAAFHLAFDAFRDGDYDVFYRGPDGTEEAVAGSARFEAHPSLALDGAGRVWLAWDSAEEAWGLVGGGLHRERRLHLAVRAGSGWHESPFPLPEIPGFAELPRVVASPAGPVWLLFRRMERWDAEAAEDFVPAQRVCWQIWAMALTERGWSEPVMLPDSDGPNHDTLAALALAGGAVLAVYESDGRLERFAANPGWPEPLPGRQRLRGVELRCAGAAPGIGPSRPVGRTAPPSPPGARDPDPGLAPEGFVRLWGDLHRHSDLSRCKMDRDGSVLDQFRYAVDVAGLDFLAVTDHRQHMTPATWAFLRATTERFELPGRFVTLHGFERAIATGHRNLFTPHAADAELAPFLPVVPHDPWRGFAPERWIVIPHQAADRFAPLDWSRPEPALERLAEIFQRRGSYEARDGVRRDLSADPAAQHLLDHLLAGLRFGFVASSDHLDNSSAFAAVYARSRSREDLFEGLRARRTYAATAPMALDVRLGELLVGAEGSVPAGAALAIAVEAGAEIARVEVVRNGAVAARWAGVDAGASLLTLRAGRTGSREIALFLEGATAGIPLGLSLEPGDQLLAPAGGGAAVLLRASFDAPDDDGFVLPVRHGAEAALVLRVGGKERRYPLAELAASTPLGFRMANTLLDLRLDPPPLGGERFEVEWIPGDWRPGDWVYVRVVRTDGQLAWSSPIWVD